MIESRIPGKARTTVPRAVRAAPGLRGGHRLACEIDGDRVLSRRAGPSLELENPFATFTERADERDSAYDDL